MRKISTLALSLAFLAGSAVAMAQTTTHKETKTTATGQPDQKTETVVGIVKEYEAGKKIKLTGPNDKTYSFDLDTNASVDGTILLGQKARVQYWKDDTGRERVTVISQATSEAIGAATAPKMHVESTTKHSGPGTDEKIQSETVVGVIKEYEAGKKIVVAGPKDKDFTFDLDENVALKGSFAVGSRVKVVYSKASGRDKVTTIEPYSAN